MNKLAIISLVLVSASAFAAKPHVYKGWVGDAKCGAKSASPNHKACAVACLKGGAAYVFVLDKGKKVYTIDNPATVKGHEGDLIQVTGVLKGSKIHINAMKMLKQPKSQIQKGEHTTTK
ncbi:MAG: hypothetical protein ACYC96_15165 [Fimbriimonadaceae bacterium]